MLASDLNPEHDSHALIKDALHDETVTEEKLQHLRETLSDNPIVSGWINAPYKDNSVETMIDHLRDRIEKFETNKHLRELESQVSTEVPTATPTVPS